MFGPSARRSVHVASCVLKADGAKGEESRERLCSAPGAPRGSVLLFTRKENSLPGRQQLEHEENRILKGMNKSRGQIRIRKTDLKNTEKQVCGAGGGTSMSRERLSRVGIRRGRQDGDF